jgi:hypothetical protein
MYGENQDHEHKRFLGHTVNQHPRTLRLVRPQWQGAGVESIREFFSEVPFEEARRGYAVGAAVLNAVLPAHSGPTALVSGRVWRSWSQQTGRDRSEGGSSRATDQCEVTPEARDGIKKIYMNSLAKKLVRCWEIVERYRAEFNKQIGSYKRPEAHSQIIAAPYVMRLEEECHNFLYEAKSFIRDVLKAFNLLYGNEMGSLAPSPLLSCRKRCPSIKIVTLT